MATLASPSTRNTDEGMVGLYVVKVTANVIQWSILDSVSYVGRFCFPVLGARWGLEGGNDINMGKERWRI